MKKSYLVLALTVTALLVGGIAAAATPQAMANSQVIRLNKFDQGRQIQLRGQLLVIELNSNPSTGYGWQAVDIDKRVLRQVETRWTPDHPGLLGSSGKVELKFAAVGLGRTRLELQKRRAWEKAAPLASFSVQVNAASLTRRELIPAQPKPQAAQQSMIKSDLPSSFSWCDQNVCTPVRDQGQCGSCWAFGTVGALEPALVYFDGDNPQSTDRSEQFLVSCNDEGWGCNGGWFAHDYHVDPGSVLESDFPYTATDQACPAGLTYHEKLLGWNYIAGSGSVPSVDAIKKAIYAYGPVAAAVCVDNNFQLYNPVPGDDVFKPRKPCNSINHAIVLVGWDDARGAWILRNSWGPDWGVNGYMYIAYGKSKVGYAANYVMYDCDSDADGYANTAPACGGTDCNDGDPNVFPGALELCDGVDNNCDGTVDEGCGGGQCLPAGDPCSSGFDCCSGQCHPRKHVCK